MITTRLHVDGHYFDSFTVTSLSIKRGLNTVDSFDFRLDSAALRGNALPTEGKIEVSVDVDGVAAVQGYAQSVHLTEDGQYELRCNSRLTELTQIRSKSNAKYQDQQLIAILLDLLAYAPDWRLGNILTMPDFLIRTTLDLRGEKRLFAQIIKLVESVPNLYLREGAGRTLELGTFNLRTRPFIPTAAVLSLTVETTYSEITRQIEAYGGQMTFITMVPGTATPEAGLWVTASSSNPTLVPDANIELGQIDLNQRTVKVTPLPGLTGVTNITLTVDDGGLTTSDVFQVTVDANADRPPTISPVADQVTAFNTITGWIPFTVGDVDSSVGGLTVTAIPDNPTLLNGILFSGSGANRLFKVYPQTGQTGWTIVTLIVSDGLRTAQTRFRMTVLEVNVAPTLTHLPDQVIRVSTATELLHFTVGDVEAETSVGLSEQPMTTQRTVALSDALVYDPSLASHPAFPIVLDKGVLVVRNNRDVSAQGGGEYTEVYSEIVPALGENPLPIDVAQAGYALWLKVCKELEDRKQNGEVWQAQTAYLPPGFRVGDRVYLHANASRLYHDQYSGVVTKQDIGTVSRWLRIPSYQESWSDKGVSYDLDLSDLLQLVPLDPLLALYDAASTALDPNLPDNALALHTYAVLSATLAPGLDPDCYNIDEAGFYEGRTLTIPLGVIPAGSSLVTVYGEALSDTAEVSLRLVSPPLLPDIDPIFCISLNRGWASGATVTVYLLVEFS